MTTIQYLEDQAARAERACKADHGYDHGRKNSCPLPAIAAARSR